jgi:tRNA U34 5-carboxymethylaminomethyl modifying GTPase MnmE/TrmE
MLHLALVQKNDFSDGVALQLLARQQSEDSWVVMAKEDVVSVAKADSLNENLLVLVELDNTNQVLSIKDAKDWVLDLVQQYLTSGITPGSLQHEAERAEQWRQDLTLQSQELARRTMEMEARQEQIQALEEDLKRKEKQLEKREEELNSQMAKDA